MWVPKCYLSPASAVPCGKSTRQVRWPRRGSLIRGADVVFCGAWPLAGSHIKVTVGASSSGKADSTVWCRHVIVTAPVSVLQAGCINFLPPLPDAKRDAIRRIKMGHYAKVICAFDTVFWPKDAPMLHYAAPMAESGRASDHWLWFPSFVNYFAIKGVPVLTGVLVGHHAEQAAALPDDEGGLVA